MWKREHLVEKGELLIWRKNGNFPHCAMFLNISNGRIVAVHALKLQAHCSVPTLRVFIEFVFFKQEIFLMN
jgi:hypothetical protein